MGHKSQKQAVCAAKPVDVSSRTWLETDRSDSFLPRSAQTYLERMTTLLDPLPRRNATRRTALALLVGIVIAALVTTLMQVGPNASAATTSYNGVTVTQNATTASIVPGTTSNCVIRTTATFSGDETKANEFAQAAAEAARKNGASAMVGGPQNGEFELILRQEFELSQWAIDPVNCSTQATIEAHRGRVVLEMPEWARGMVASAAGLAVYLTITLAVTALFTFLAPELAIWGEVIGGCIGGFASTFVSNWINKVPQQANMTSSAVQCVAGAVLNVTLGAVKTQMVEKLRAYLGTGAAGAVGDGIAASAGHSGEISSEFQSAASQLSQELATVPTNP